MLLASLSLLDPDQLSDLHHKASEFYRAEAAVTALKQAQEQFRRAASCSLLGDERTSGVLHELDALVDDHQPIVDRLFETYQTAAFGVLEPHLEPSIRGRTLVVRQFVFGELHLAYSPFVYARLDLDMRYGVARDKVRLHVSQSRSESGAPDPAAGRSPSRCRTHTFDARTGASAHHWSAEVLS